MVRDLVGAPDVRPLHTAALLDSPVVLLEPSPFICKTVASRRVHGKAAEDNRYAELREAP